MNTIDREPLDHEFSFARQQAIIARAHAERAEFVMQVLARVPGLIRRLFHRTATPKVGATRAMATAYGARC